MNAGKKILVVDDDPDITAQLALVLKEEGYEVTVANSQAEGEEALLAGKPDLAIIDLMMEHQDSGFVLCHELKKVHPDTPVIFLTAVKAATGMSFTPSSPEEKSWVKAECVLDKPVRPEHLRNQVRRLLSPGGTGAGPAKPH